MQNAVMFAEQFVYIMPLKQRQRVLRRYIVLIGEGASMKLYHGSNCEFGRVEELLPCAKNMHTKYIYKDQDLTVDILFKIEHVASIIAEKEIIAFEEAYRKFLDSKVYNMLQNTKTLMWTESAEFIADEFYREK